MKSDTYALKTIHNTCFLKPGQLLDDGRVFRHGSYRTRLIYEFERDPNGPRRRWEQWKSDNRDKPRERTDSIDVNSSAGEDGMKIEADDADVDVDNSHKERGTKIREWQEKTKKERQPRIKIEKQIKKKQPAVGRKTVNHFVNDLDDPRSDDEISDDDWKLEPKVKIDPGNTIPWSTTSSRSFSDPTVANPNNTTQATGINSPDNGGLYQGYSANALGATDTYHPTTPHSRFNFNPPAAGTHTKYMTGKPQKHHGSGSAYTDNAMDLGSPKPKPKTRAQALAQSEMQAPISITKFDANRSTYHAMPIDVHTSFWAGHMNTSFANTDADADADADADIETDTDNPPPYSPQSSSILPVYNTSIDAHAKNYNGPSGYAGMSDVSSASGYIGYSSTYGENQGVFGNYASAESDERERKKVRVGEAESEVGDGNVKQMVHDMDSAEGDVKMGGE
ncbi:hypothetical protein OCU04_011691 [Sclerotinia nivalis]|uniref:Uncharacterized protein n=1 Tax=Sclerotinia nivalis TaxID=352851 RepID=A0A9X0AC13_9HELO|nr:hypothetical protein OCU04_011691 [Sclerotinia nivalis]